MSTSTRDPLKRIGGELMAAAARNNRRRVRRRRVLAIAALPAILVAASTGAAAVGELRTGVGVVDRLLQTEGGGNDGIDRRPGPGSASDPLSLPNSPDGKGAAAIAYLSRDGRVCEAQADLRRRDGAVRGTSGGPCYRPRDLARTLSRRKAICCGSSNGLDRRIYTGLAAAEVVALRFRTESGGVFNARLTRPWTPDAAGAEPLRLFVAVDERDLDVGGDGVQMEEADLLFQRYRVLAELSDGRTVEIVTP